MRVNRHPILPSCPAAVSGLGGGHVRTPLLDPNASGRRRSADVDDSATVNANVAVCWVSSSVQAVPRCHVLFRGCFCQPGPSTRGAYWRMKDPGLARICAAGTKVRCRAVSPCGRTATEH